MSQTVIHQPRVVWDGARAFVRAANGSGYDAFSATVLSRLGSGYYGELANTRQRLQHASIESSDNDRFTVDVEASRWRVRLDELIRNRPDLIPVIQELTTTV
ncbi:hypothetical protein GCM10010435_36840 [Winogradskya consettensis]|uniref:Uncharacterized protein n=2 Tax=Winogradskya TaxID=3240235 RepID=A0A919SZQ6_9ACTN|nr:MULTISPECIES: hypothetical protein [Actinoplanes]GIE17726.1 hypothetical protein Ahu01nite_008280 [Actinoplanes humidus]GIM81604.1 hypothetical protein Aco04nite_77410 [Actinoplanes consettensis]